MRVQMQVGLQQGEVDVPNTLLIEAYDYVNSRDKRSAEVAIIALFRDLYRKQTDKLSHLH